MNVATSRMIDRAVSERPMDVADRQMLRFVQHQLSDEQRFASSIFAALDAGTAAQRASLRLAQPELFAAWEAFRHDGLGDLVRPDEESFATGSVDRAEVLR